MATKKNAQSIKLADISLSPFNPRKFIDETALQELAASIEKHGVIQAIVIRPVEKGYELVAGERRYRAAKIAGLKEIPATIKELTDSEALEIAIIENLQRVDVHPMNEAVAFKQMQEQYLCGLSEIAGRLGRSEKYIAQRLKLNDLTEGFQAMFFEGKILLGHALELCKLVPKDQEYILGKINGRDWSWKSIGEESVAKLKQNIGQSFRKKLEEAPFDTLDNDLFPEAGGCAGCQFNTACNALLFQEEEAICTNVGCYDTKAELAYQPNLQQAIDDPSIVLIHVYGDKAPVKKLKEAGHVVYEQYDDFQLEHRPSEPNFIEVDREDYETDEDYYAAVQENKDEYAEELQEYKEQLLEFEQDIASGAIINGFLVNGSGRGKTAHIRLKVNKGGTASAIADQKPNAAQISAINQKLTRGRELDGEKGHKNIVQGLFELPQFQLNGPVDETLTAAEMEGLYYFIYQQLGWQEMKDVRQRFGLSDNRNDIIQRMSNMTDGEFAWVWRLVLKSKFKSSLPPYSEAAIVRKVAEYYIPEDITKLELDQEGIRERREAKLNAQLAALQTETEEASK